MKTTTKKIILGLSALTLLSSAAYAYGMDRGGCDMKNKHHKMMKMKHHKKGDHIIGAIMQLELSSEQKEKIAAILKEARESRQGPSIAFTAKEFDKGKFVKLMKEQRESRIEQKAQTIEKILKAYKISQ